MLLSAVFQRAVLVNLVSGASDQYTMSAPIARRVIMARTLAQLLAWLVPAGIFHARG